MYNICSDCKMYKSAAAKRDSTPMIEVKINELLLENKRTFYWLAKQTGISHTTLWRLKKGKAVGINFPTLEKICEALKCEPGDILKIQSDKSKGKVI